MNMLRGLGKDIDALTPADLAPEDELRIRGREATLELARLCGVTSDVQVPDVGSGLGGSARKLSIEHGYHGTGLGFTEEFCQVAAMFSSLLGLADRDKDRQGLR